MTARAAYPHTRRHPFVKIRIRVGPSRIAGLGLFAEQDIRQGTKIIRYIGEKITQEESERRLAAGNVYIFGLDERYAIDGSTPNTHGGELCIIFSHRICEEHMGTGF
jgi:hypothetical protein